MPRAALLVAGSLLVAGAAYWFFRRPMEREAGIDEPAVAGADAGGRRGPGAELAVPGGRRLAAEEATSKVAAADTPDDQVPAPTVFRFRVYNAGDGTFVPGALIETTSGERLGTSDAQGRLDVEIVSIVYLSVRVHREGFVEWRGDPIGDRTREPLKEADPRIWDVDLEPGVPVDGRVVLSTGEPVPSAWILVNSDAGPVSRGKGRGSVDLIARSTDRQGRFHFEGLAAGLELSFEVAAPGRRPLVRSLTLDGPEKDLRLTMPDAGVVGGVVRDADGRPMGGAVVWLVKPDDSAPRFEDVESALAGSVRRRFADVPWGITHADGTYSIAGLAPEKPVVPVVRAAEMLEGRGNSVALHASGEPQVRDIRLPRAAHLRVTLIVAPADAIGEAAVRARSELDSFDLVKAPSAGGTIWVASPATPDPYDIVIDIPDRPKFRFGTVTLVAGETRELRIEIPASREISGVVVDAEDHPLPGVSVDWSTESVQPSSVSTDEAGAFHFRVWPGANGRIHVRGPPPLFEAVVEAVAPGTTGMRIVLR